MSYTKRSYLHLYDNNSRTELFETQVKPGQVMLSTAGTYDLYASKLSVHNANGVVIHDVAAAIANIASTGASQADLDANLVHLTNVIDGFIDNEFAGEVAARTAADADLQNQIHVMTDFTIPAESSARYSADEALGVRIDAEVTDRMSAVKAVDDRVDTILAGSSVNFDTLKEIVDAYQLQDTGILSTITTMQNAHTDLLAQFNALKLVVDTLTGSVV